MSINAEFLGLIVLLSLLLTGSLSFYLGKRKTRTPLVVTAIGLVLAFLPPLGLLYVAALSLKSDIVAKEATTG